MTSYVALSWDAGKISKDNKILIENLRKEKSGLGAKEMLKVGLPSAKQWSI